LDLQISFIIQAFIKKQLFFFNLKLDNFIEISDKTKEKGKRS